MWRISYSSGKIVLYIYKELGKMKGYLANGLFSESDRAYNELIARRVRDVVEGIELYVPQENAALNDKSGYADSVTIFKGDNDYLDKSDLLIAVIDGVEIDSGVAAEIGRFALLRQMDIVMFGESKREILALYTDVRLGGASNTTKVSALIEDSTENQFMYRNLYVLGAVKEHGRVFNSLSDLINYLGDR